MKTVQQLQEEVYDQAVSSGYFRNMQAQLKSYVFDLIEKEYGGGKNRGFQYQHPLLQKIRQYPLTSLCLDLMQQFLQSFKFKHTLNVFKKQINRNYNVSRRSLAEQFRIQIKNPEAQAVLVSIVTQMASGEVGAVRDTRQQPPLRNNFVERKQEQQQPQARSNYIMNQQKQPNMASTQGSFKGNNTGPSQAPAQKSFNQSSSVSNSASLINEPKGSSISDPQVSSSKIDSSGSPSVSKEVAEPSSSQVNASSNAESSKMSSKDEKKGKKKKEEKEKPPEGATDFLGQQIQKFQKLKKKDKEEEKKKLFDEKRAFSEEKKAKVVDPSQSGANKIRGASMGKGGMSSMMSKFMPQAFQQPKNESFVEQQLDEFQISKDSTRKNPLFSSSESGFDKSGFDESVESSLIDQYEYSERARKVFKKQ